MKIKKELVLTTLDGTPMQDADGSEATFAKVATAAVLFEGKDPLPGDKKWERWQLAEKINNAEGEIELTIEDAKVIQDSVAQLYNVAVYGRIRQLLND